MGFRRQSPSYRKWSSSAQVESCSGRCQRIRLVQYRHERRLGKRRSPLIWAVTFNELFYQHRIQKRTLALRGRNVDRSLF